MIQRWGLLLGTLAMLCGEAWTQGESEGDLASDRPSESAAASLLPAGFGRAEIGGRMTWLTDAESGAQTFSYAAPLGVLRYGMNEWVELRVGARFSGSVGAVDDAMLGAKLRLPGDKGLLPRGGQHGPEPRTRREFEGPIRTQNLRGHHHLPPLVLDRKRGLA